MIEKICWLRPGDLVFQSMNAFMLSPEDVYFVVSSRIEPEDDEKFLVTFFGKSGKIWSSFSRRVNFDRTKSYWKFVDEFNDKNNFVYLKNEEKL